MIDRAYARSLVRYEIDARRWANKDLDTYADVPNYAGLTARQRRIKRAIWLRRDAQQYRLMRRMVREHLAAHKARKRP